MNLTRRASLCLIPAAEKHLMEVTEGMETLHAISLADCLDGAVRKLLTEAVAGGGMDVDIAFLCEFAMDAAHGLRTASGVTA